MQATRALWEIGPAAIAAKSDLLNATRSRDKPVLKRPCGGLARPK
jgi:hypothetical protein